MGVRVVKGGGKGYWRWGVGAKGMGMWKGNSEKK